MSLLKKLLRGAKILAVSLVFTLVFFSPVAMAATSSYTGSSINPLRMIHINQEGAFKVNKVGSIKQETTIRSAVVSLQPPDETGTIEAIVITGLNGKREFACAGLKVQNGTDLIQSCGGPAILVTGETTYTAMGSGFTPNPNASLSVDLRP